MSSDGMTRRDKIVEIAVCLLLCLFVLWILPCFVRAETITASWYSRSSCRVEGTSGIMANGKELNDEALTAASWDYAFGKRVRITNLKNGRACVVVITDRGPARWLYRMGRKIDLSRAAFNRLADLKQGIIPVSIEPL